MRIANQLIRWTIPGGIFLAVWGFYLLVETATTNGCPSKENLRAFWGTLRFDTEAFVAFAGVALFLGWILAQIYWALYWIPRAGWPARLFLIIDESKTLREGLADTKQLVPLDRKHCLAIIDMRIRLDTQPVQQNERWASALERITGIYDAYHSLGTSALATLVALITIHLFRLATVTVSGWCSFSGFQLTDGPMLTFLMVLTLLSLFMVARFHAGFQAQQYMIEMLRRTSL